MFGELDYDHFLAEVSQTVAVDVAAAGGALARLVGDEALRALLGAAARKRALDLFAWPRVIAAYEALWRDQETQRQDYARVRAGTATIAMCRPITRRPSGRSPATRLAGSTPTVPPSSP